MKLLPLAFAVLVVAGCGAAEDLAVSAAADAAGAAEAVDEARALDAGAGRSDAAGAIGAGARADGGAPQAPSMPPARDGGAAAPPAPWKAGNVGAAAAGESLSSPSAFAFKFAGRGISGTADSFHFAYQALKGDGEIVARVSSLAADPSARVGVMVRAGPDPAAPNAALLAVPDGAQPGYLQARRTAGAATMTLKTDPNIRADRGWWMRLQRRGTTITAFRSQTGDYDWLAVATVELPDLPPEALWGVAMSLGSDGEPGTVEFLDVLVNNLAAEPPFRTWRQSDVGSVGGTASAAGTSVAVAGWGEPPLKDRESFSVAYEPLKAGNVTIAARLVGQSGNTMHARAGIAIRQAPNSASRRNSGNPGAWIYVSAAAGVVFEARGDSGGTMKVATAADLKPPVWLKLEKVAARFTASVSRDGLQWTPLGSSAPTIAMSPDLTAGLFAGSGSYTAMNTATFESIAVGAPP